MKKAFANKNLNSLAADMLEAFTGKRQKEMAIKTEIINDSEMRGVALILSNNPYINEQEQLNLIQIKRQYHANEIIIGSTVEEYQIEVRIYSKKP